MSKFSYFPRQVKRAFPVDFALDRDPKNIFYIVGTLPVPLIKGGGKTFQKLSHLGVVVWHFLLERGDKPEKGGGHWCRNGGVITFCTLFGIQRKVNGQFFFYCPGKTFLSIEKISLSFTPYVGPKQNIYLSHYCAKFELKV